MDASQQIVEKLKGSDPFGEVPAAWITVFS
jgi:hypothetical protein